MKKNQRPATLSEDPFIQKAVEWYGLVSNSPSNLLWDWNFLTGAIKWSDSICKRFGYSKKAMVSSYGWWEEKVHPDDVRRVQRTLNEAVKNRSMSWSDEYRFARKDGTYAYVSDRGYIVYDKENAPIRLIGVMQDVSERMSAVTMNQQAEENFRNLAETIPQLVWVTRPDGYHEYYNRHWYKFVGGTSSTGEEVEWDEVIHPDDKPAALKLWRKSLKTGELFNVEYRLRNGESGEYHWFLGRALPIKNTKGKIIKWFGTCTDIHEQKIILQSQAFLAEASKVLSSSLDYQTTLDSVARLAVPEIADWCSVEFLDGDTTKVVAIAHKDPKKIEWSKKLRQEFPVDMSSQTGIPQVLRTGKSEFYPVVTTEMLEAAATSDGQRKIIREIGFSSFMIVPIKIEKKTIGAIQFVATESKKHFTQRDLEMAEELAVRAGLAVHNAVLYERAQGIERQFKALYDSNIIGVMSSDKNDTVVSANDAFLQIVGYTRNDLKKNRINLSKLTPGEFKQKQTEITSQLSRTGSVAPFEKEFCKKDGSQVPVIIGSVMLNKEGEEFLSFVLDITERKRLEQRKDEFIGIASHELRTPLTSVKGYVQILERIIKQMGDERLNTYIRKTNTYIDRLNSLISELLDVSKIQAGKLQLNFADMDFDSLMTESIEAVQYTVNSHKIVNKGKTHAVVRADKNRLEQVITNLLTNAIKYSPNADKIVVTSSMQGNEIVVSVQDFGIGISKKEIRKVFQRFYRVESSAKSFSGLGIGLFISSEILSRHNGRIWAESTEKKGSTFFFSVPATKKEN